MNHVSKLLTLAALAMTTAVSAWADQTNLVQELNIQLNGIKQGPTTTVRNQVITSLDYARVGTRQVVEALGTATGNTFSQSARLVVITPLGGGYSKVVVRDGGNSVDVSSFFDHTQQGGEVTSSVLNTRSNRGVTNVYGIQRFVLADSPVYGAVGIHFDVNGIAVDNSSTDASAPGSETNADVVGSGDKAGTTVILQGTIRIRGHTLEVEPSIVNPNV